jgi:hypothetical protein
MDPDDHWDLACQYALAVRQWTDLHGILIDYPPDESREPDVFAVAQMNDIAGRTVPVAVGTSIPVAGRRDGQAEVHSRDRNGVRFIRSTLRSSPEPVTIHVVGSCRDVALAANADPGLFAEKCRAIYLNAGSGDRSPANVTEVEYNVKLNRHAYAAMFDVPCPLYWLPCRQEPYDGNVHEWASYWRFRQADVLSGLSLPLQRYFASVLAKVAGNAWLSTIRANSLDNLIPSFIDDRNMWCTAGFLHAAGRGVDLEGAIVPLGKEGAAEVFSFEPVSVTCSDEGETAWHPDPSSTDRYIFHVTDVAHYQAAMTSALVTLLRVLG